MNKWKRIVGMCLVVLMTITSGMLVFAADTQEIAEQKKTSVLQIVVFSEDKEGVVYPVQGGSGFLIGDNEDGAEYLVSAKEVTDVTAETEKQLIEFYKENRPAPEETSEKEEEIKLEYYVKAIVKKDIMIDVSLVAESTEMGFSVWKLSQKLFDREPLVLYDQPAMKVTGQKSLVLGFLTAPNWQESIYYTMDDIIYKEGMFTGDSKENDVTYIGHNMEVNPGMIGGPILTESGSVVAINQARRSQSGYYGLQISELLPVLEAMGIPYKTLSQVEKEEADALAAIVHKEKLQLQIQAAEELDSRLYTKKSYEAVLASLVEAKEVESNEDATQQEVDEKLVALIDVMDGLKNKPPVGKIILYTGIVVVILSLVGIIIWLLTKPARENKKQKKLAEYTVTEAAPVFSEQKVQKEDYRQLLNRNTQEYMTGSFSSSSSASFMGGADGGETTVFQQSDAGMGSSQQGNVVLGYLIRQKTKEKISISQREFVIGKDPSQTDYCVEGNSAISRAHAVITFNGADAGVTDKNATNGTFVNGMRVAPFQQNALKDGDMLRLADEEFEFKKH